MIIRIVRMHFTADGAHEFRSIFRENMHAIQHFDGCLHVQLLKDANDGNSFATLSHWQSPDHLERYRESILFKNVWSRVKPLFTARPQAFSLEDINNLS